MRQWRGMLSAVRARSLLVAAGALLCGAWLVAPPSGVPLYDGVGFPDEPYRYVVPPVGAPKTKPPTVASVTVQISDGVSGTANAVSGEQGPQVTVYVPTGGLVVPPGAQFATLVATPVPPPQIAPDGTILGDVYRVFVETGAGAGGLAPSAVGQAQILLRAPKAEPRLPALEVYAAGHWTRLPSDRFGNDIYGGYIRSFGEFALVRLNPAAVASGAAAGGAGAAGRVASHSATSGLRVTLVAAAAVIFVLAAVVLAVRLHRRRADV